MIATVIVFPNGLVAVCDEHGQQIPAYQGRWTEMREAILRDKPAHVIIEGAPISRPALG